MSRAKAIDGCLTVASQVRLAEAEAGGQGGVVAAERRGRSAAAARWRADEQAAVWWLGAHGGAGEIDARGAVLGVARGRVTLADGRAAGEPPARVVLVARTHAHGLRAAQRAIREWAAGTCRCCCSGWC